MIETVAKAGIAVGVWNIYRNSFWSSKRKSDGANIHLDYFEELMTKLVAIRQTINQF
jgi:2-dehydro-3-deoxyphosphooctonate aldolase (KDO 8-P synthase)